MPNTSNKFKTWILVLGIVAVGGLDLMFTTFMSAGTGAVENVAVIKEDTDDPDLLATPTEPAAATTNIGDRSIRKPARSHPAIVEVPRVRSAAEYTSGPIPPVKNNIARTSSTSVLPKLRQPAAYAMRNVSAVSYPYASLNYVVQVSDGKLENSCKTVYRKKHSLAVRIASKPWQFLKAVASVFR